MIPEGSGVYALENLLHPRVYVGSSVNFQQRYANHFGSLRSGYCVNARLTRDAQRYGTCAFRFIILQRVESPALLAEYEQIWLTYFSHIGLPCYNIMSAYRAPSSVGLPRHAPQGYRFSLADAMYRTGMSESTLRKWVTHGLVPGFKTNHSWRFCADDLVVIAAAWREHVRIMAITHHQQRRRWQDLSAREDGLC